MRATILILLTLIVSGQNAFSQIPDYREISISKKANGQIDFSKLEFLKYELEKADIVLLGEPSHSPEYYDIKIQLVKYLHGKPTVNYTLRGINSYNLLTGC